MPRTVYIAGPLFSEQDRMLLLQIEKSFTEHGISCFVPHREVGDLAVLREELGAELSRSLIFDSDIDGVEECIVVCALLDGPDVDSGTAAEMGFAHALGRPVFGLCTDGFRRGKTMNNVIWGICESGARIYTKIPDLTKAVAEHVAQCVKTSNKPDFRKRIRNELEAV